MIAFILFIKVLTIQILRLQYSEGIEWKQEWFVRSPRSHWQSMENRRKFFDQLAVTLNLKNPSDWGKISLKQICAMGGAGILYYYKNSVFYCLQSIYKGIYFNIQPLN